MNASLPTPTSDLTASTGAFTSTAKCPSALSGELGTTSMGNGDSAGSDFASLLADSSSGESASTAELQAALASTLPVAPVVTVTLPVLATGTVPTEQGLALAAAADPLTLVMPMHEEAATGEGTSIVTVAITTQPETATDEETPTATPTPAGSVVDGQPTSGPTGRKKQRKIPGLGRFLHSCGRHSATATKSAQPQVLTQSKEITLTSKLAPANGTAQTKEITVTAKVVLTEPACHPEMAAPTLSLSLQGLTSPVRPQGAGALANSTPMTAGAGEENVETTTEASPESRKNSRDPAPAGGLLAQAAANRPFGTQFAHRSDATLPSFAKHLTATEPVRHDPTIRPAQPSMRPEGASRVRVSDALRTEIAATLTTVLAPLLQELSGAWSAVGTTASPAALPIVMVKVSGLPPFRLDLPPLTTSPVPVLSPTPVPTPTTPVLVPAEPVGVAASPLLVPSVSGETSAALPEVAAQATPAPVVPAIQSVVVGAAPTPRVMDTIEPTAPVTHELVNWLESAVSAACADAREVLPTEWPELSDVQAGPAEAVLAPVESAPVPSAPVTDAPEETTSPLVATVVTPTPAPVSAQPTALSPTGAATIVNYKIILPGLGTIQAEVVPAPVATTPVSTAQHPDMFALTGIVNALPNRRRSEGEKLPLLTPATPGSLTPQIGATNHMPEKSAADSNGKNNGEGSRESDVERKFLNAMGQSFKAKFLAAGIDVAEKGTVMPSSFTSHRVAVDQLELPSARMAMRDLTSVAFAPQFAPLTPTSSTPAPAATPAPALAHRAVETILNVVEAQRTGLTQATSVNLHFKFGGDDLAVRVQMRGTEVLTQFITDSPELRMALANEWQSLVSQGAASSLKLHDPVIMPGSAQVSTGFGSASQHQQSAQHQHAQQHQQAQQQAAAFQELRSLRRAGGFAPTVSSAAETPSRSITLREGSRRLAALA